MRRTGFEVMDMDGHRVDKVLVMRTRPQSNNKINQTSQSNSAAST